MKRCIKTEIISIGMMAMPVCPPSVVAIIDCIVVSWTSSRRRGAATGRTYSAGCGEASGRSTIDRHRHSAPAPLCPPAAARLTGCRRRCRRPNPELQRPRHRLDDHVRPTEFPLTARTAHNQISVGPGSRPRRCKYPLACLCWWLGSRVAACWTQAQKGPGLNRSRDAVG